MSAKTTSGAILIKQGTLLPGGNWIETEEILPARNVVNYLDRRGLDRKIEKANWNFFSVAGPNRVTVIGRDRPAALRRAIKRALAKREGQNSNSLQTTRIASKRFLGVPFLNIAAHSRHLQEGMSSVSATDFVLRTQITTQGKQVATEEFAAVSSSC
ncbi:MAG TPA: hypothetical protein VNH65_16705 [Candidatus Acidoferrum sp.]|nr:hypothetical protein [Candidatus Acidoferrum sp.]